MNKFITTAAILLMPVAMFAQSDRVQCTETTQCSGITKSNTQCKNKTKHSSGKCHHHRD